MMGKMFLRTAWSLGQEDVFLKQYNNLFLNDKPFLSRIMKVAVLGLWKDMLHFGIVFLFRTFLL